MTARSIPRNASSVPIWARARWISAFAEGTVLLALLCGLVISAALLSRPA